MKSLSIVCDLQFGSTGKGQLCGILARELAPQVVATAWGPNAGHTYVDAAGRKFIHTALAIAMLAPTVQAQLIGPGSVLDMSKLLEEACAAQDLLRGKQILIHPNACVRMPRHLEQEKELVRVGSTMKGTGAAMVEKIWRDPENSPLVRDAWPQERWGRTWRRDFEDIGITLSADESAYNEVVDTASRVMLEGAQGFSLGIHTRFWPYTTSRDVTPAQMIADCRLPLIPKTTVWGTMRTFPIRVANRFQDGVQVGTSGGCYADQQELDWKQDLGRPPEFTTVTKLPRRVFSFSARQVLDAVRVCGVTRAAITFADYIAPKPESGAQLPKPLRYYVDLLQTQGVVTRYVHFGPGERDVMALDSDFICTNIVKVV